MATKKVIDALAKLSGQLSDIKSEIEVMRDAAQEAYDDMSEKVQDGDRGQRLQEDIGQFDEAIGYLESAETAFENIVSAA